MGRELKARPVIWLRPNHGNCIIPHYTVASSGRPVECSYHGIAHTKVDNSMALQKTCVDIDTCKTEITGKW